VIISVVVSNIGGSRGRYTVILTINDRPEATKDVELEANQSQMVTFNIAADAGGKHAIDVNGNSGEFSVVVPLPTLTETTEIVPVVPVTNWPLYVGVTAALGGIVVIGLSTLITLHRRSGYRINGK
jgi:hypothetical protein